MKNILLILSCLVLVGCQTQEQKHDAVMYEKAVKYLAEKESTREYCFRDCLGGIDINCTHEGMTEKQIGKHCDYVCGGYE